MAGTVTINEETFGTVKKITFDWLSSAGGAADATTVNYYSGIISRVVTIPDGGGTQPTDLYDLVLNDDDSVDLLDSQGLNRSNASTQQLFVGLGTIANALLTLGITNAGNAKGGNLVVYIT